MHSLVRDVHFTLRSWRRNPGSTFAAILTLTIGIGGTTAIFAIISALLLQPLPLSDADNIIAITSSDKYHDQSLVSMPDALDMKTRLHAASRVAIFADQIFNLASPDKTLLVHALVVDCELLALLGVQPEQGGGFNCAELQASNGSRVLLSWAFWQKQFAGKPMLGETLRLDDQVFQVAGILPRDLDLPLSSDIWVPLAFNLSKPNNDRAIHTYYALARLRNGATQGEIQSELSRLSDTLARENPAEDKGVKFTATRLRDWIAGDVKTPLFLLLAAIAGVLLMACANVANLLLARSSSRIREISVRIAVGASRWRLFQQLMTESVMLASCAAIAGLAFAALALNVLKSVPNTQIPRNEYIALDWRVFAFALCVATLTSLLFGVLPAVKTSAAPVMEVLRQAGGRLTDSTKSQILRRALLALETTIASALLIGAVQLVASYRAITHLDPGFQTDHLLTVFLSLPDSRYGTDSVYAARFADKLLPMIKALPGVKQATLTRNLPLTMGGNGPIQVEGQPLPEHLWDSPFVIREEITPEYRRTLNIPLLRGRDFDQREDLPGATGILINATAAELYFHGNDPIGRRISYRVNPRVPSTDWHEIIGIVGDTRRGNDLKKTPAIFVPLYRAASPYPALIVRTEGDPASYTHAVENVVHKVDPAVPCFLFHTMGEVMAQQLGWRAFDTSLLSVFTAAALVLAALGIFSVVAYSVSQRTSEIGLRMACGASQIDVFVMILLQGLAPATTGIIAGILLSLGFGRYLESMLSGVTLKSPEPYVVAGLFLLLIAAVASLIPARRAAATDPWVALRYE